MQQDINISSQIIQFHQNKYLVFFHLWFLDFIHMDMILKYKKTLWLVLGVWEKYSYSTLYYCIKTKPSTIYSECMLTSNISLCKTHVQRYQVFGF